jgi:hypothetical protein
LSSQLPACVINPEDFFKGLFYVGICRKKLNPEDTKKRPTYNS